MVTQWLMMGGYAGYIWSAFGVVAMAMMMNVMMIKKESRRVKRLLVQQVKHASIT